MIAVKWLEGKAKGCIDLLPKDWFLKKGSFNKKYHYVRGPKSGWYLAKCTVKVADTYADLDYKAFSTFNKKQGMLLGIMRIQFENENRQYIKHILWNAKEKTDETEIDYESSNGSGLPLGFKLKNTRIEGGKKLSTHLERERKSKLATAKRADVLCKLSKLACEVCGFTFEEEYGTLGEEYCEVHHREPLAVGGIRSTNPSHLAILCSNCHSMIHRTVPMSSVEKFRETCVCNGKPK